MFTWIGAKFDSVLSAYAFGVVSKLMAVLTPVVLTVMTLWVALFGWAVLRNEVSEPVHTFMWKVFKILLILVFSSQASFYMSNVAELATTLTTSVATTFLPEAADARAVSSPYALIDAFNEQASQNVVDLMKNATFFRIDLTLATMACSVGNVIFLCVALFVVTLAKVVLSFLLGVGPLFILCLAWRPTARFFDSWLSMLLNAIVLAWFVFFALGLSIYLGQAVLQAAREGGGFGGPKLNVFAESLRYCVVMVLMAVICFQAPSLASALMGGAAIQQGIQMVQNAVSLGGARRSGPSPTKPTEGGAIDKGPGATYTAGHAAGRAALAGARMAGATARGAGAVARQGYAVARTAAYKLAAMRGRT